MEFYSESLESLANRYGVSGWTVKRVLESGNRYMVAFGTIVRPYSLGGGYVSGYIVQVLATQQDMVIRFSVEEIEGYDY